MLRVLAVDDEAPALEELLYLLRADPRIRSAEGATSATEALRRIGAALDAGPDDPAAVDVVFLDIHMAGLTGLDVAKLLAGFAEPPLIVFVTAHEGFAVQAFDLKAVDYVLKPVRRERLAEAVRRVAELVGERGPVVDTSTDQIPVELGGVTRFVPVADIVYAEAQGDYARPTPTPAAIWCVFRSPPWRSAGAPAVSYGSTAAISSPSPASTNCASTPAP